MTINRTVDNSGPATMSVFFAPVLGAEAPLGGDSATQDTAVNERLETIDMKYKHESEILKELLRLTKAVEVKATEAEQESMRDIEEQRRKSDEDREFQRVVLEKRRQEQKLLDDARRAATDGIAVA